MDRNRQFVAAPIAVVDMPFQGVTISKPLIQT